MLPRPNGDGQRAGSAGWLTWEVLVDPDRDPARPWATLSADETQPTVIKAIRPSFVGWSSLRPSRTPLGVRTAAKTVSACCPVLVRRVPAFDWDASFVHTVEPSLWLVADFDCGRRSAGELRDTLGELLVKGRRAEIGRSWPIRCDREGSSARLEGPDPENGGERG